MDLGLLDARYAPARIMVLTLDFVTLVRTILDPARHGHVMESATVTHLERAPLSLAPIVEATFMRGATPSRPGHYDDETQERWRARFMAARAPLERAAVPMTERLDDAANAFFAATASETATY